LRCPCVCPSVQPEDEAEAVKLDVSVEFSGEEVGGRYLDLHEHFHAFVNAKFGRKLDYIEYVANIDNFNAIPRHHRLNQPYRCARFL
jgi:Pre-mRNA-splicing factor SF3A3, of SF3a complex, Prp9